jgi:hypothetical protein
MTMISPSKGLGAFLLAPPNTIDATPTHPNPLCHRIISLYCAILSQLQCDMYSDTRAVGRSRESNGIPRRGPCQANGN